MASFATTAELQTFLGGTGLNTTRAQAMLDHASALIRLACDAQDLEEVAGRQEEFAADDTVLTLFLSERPVTAVSGLTIDAVAFTDFEWSRWGTITRTDAGAWSTGPIIITYDSGYATTDPEWEAIKGICLEVATRAYTNERTGLETFNAAGVPEAVGWTPHLFLTEEERRVLLDFGAVGVG